MKLIVHENTRYAGLINNALAFSKVCLKTNSTFYPFALASIGDGIHSIFLEDKSELAPTSMIEKLEAQIALHVCQTESAIGILVYVVTVVTPTNQTTDALLLSISDGSGANTITIYPYTKDGTSITIGKPYTCDFND